MLFEMDSEKIENIMNVESSIIDKAEFMSRCSSDSEKASKAIAIKHANSAASALLVFLKLNIAMSGYIAALRILSGVNADIRLAFRIRLLAFILRLVPSFGVMLFRLRRV